MIFAGLALVDDCPMGWNGCAGCLERNAMVACGPNGASLCTDGPQERQRADSSRSASHGVSL